VAVSGRIPKEALMHFFVLEHPTDPVDDVGEAARFEHFCF